METATTPRKVQNMVEMIEAAGNTATLETIEYSWGEVHQIRFESTERHVMLSSFGSASFRTLRGRTKFLGGMVHSFSGTNEFKTYTDARIVVEVYTSTPTKENG